MEIFCYFLKQFGSYGEIKRFVDASSSLMFTTNAQLLVFCNWYSQISKKSCWLCGSFEEHTVKVSFITY